MSKTVVLDESVIGWALQQNSRGACCLAAVEKIIAVCHKVAWDNEWYSRCFRRIAQSGGTIQGQLLLGIFKEIFPNQAKNHYQPPPLPHHPSESNIPEDHKWLVRLCAATESVLVAEDQSLESALRTNTSIALLTCEQALVQL